jgi:transposase
MTQTDRDRLVALKKAKDKRITQRQAAEEVGLSERQVRRLIAKLRVVGDKALIHGLRGRGSNRKSRPEVERKAKAILGEKVFQGFGPTLASQYLAEKYDIQASKETVRHWMVEAGLWRSRKQRVVDTHVWRQRRERFGELVQWDTSDHAWLEGRGERIYLITMIDDASSRMFARFVRHDSTEANMAVLEEYLRRFGRPLQFYTDKASIFHTTPKKNHPEPEEPLPPTQIGRALKELGIGWLAAHSPQAKGRVERSFNTAQDRLVKGLRIAGVKTLAAANAYLESCYLSDWQTRFTVVPASADDAHRALGKQHNLATILCPVEERVVTNDYTIRLNSKIYQVARSHIRPRLRGARVRVELRRSGDVGVRFENQYLPVEVCVPALKLAPPPKRQPSPRKAPNVGGRSQWMKGFFEKPGLPIDRALAISNATS